MSLFFDWFYRHPLYAEPEQEIFKVVGLAFAGKRTYHIHSLSIDYSFGQIFITGTSDSGQYAAWYAVRVALQNYLI